MPSPDQQPTNDDAQSDAPHPLYETDIPRRRAVRRPSSLDVVDEDDAQGFASSPVERSARRRSPVGSLNSASHDQRFVDILEETLVRDKAILDRLADS